MFEVSAMYHIATALYELGLMLVAQRIALTPMYNYTGH